MKLKITHIILFFSLISMYGNAQNRNKVDSIKHVILKQKEDTNKVKSYISLSKLYKRIDIDSCLLYSTKGLELATKLKYFSGMANCYHNIGYANYMSDNFDLSIDNYKKAISFAQKINDKQGMAASYNNIGLLYESQSDYINAIDNFNKALEIDLEFKDTNSISGDYNNIGMVYWNQGNFTKSLEYYLKSLKLKEINGNKKSIAISYINIGLLHKDMQNYDLALNYYNKALAIYKEIDDQSGIANCHHNIGGVQLIQKKYTESRKSYLTALKINNEINDIKRIGDCYHNLGNIDYYQNNYSEAAKNYDKALRIYEQIDNKKDIAITLGNISTLKVIEGKYNEAIECAKKSLAYSKEIGALPTELESYQHLSFAYENLKDFKKAYEYHKLYKQINDSIYNQESSNQVKQMEAIYQSEKKQLEIDNLNKDRMVKEIQIANKKEISQNQKYLIYFIIFGLFVIVIFTVLTLRQYLAKKKTNVLLQIRYTDIQQKNEEISAQRDEIEKQRDIVISQKESISVIHEKVTSSIKYAKKIQTAILPDKEVTDIYLPEHFILFKPRDIVSGDFYWTMIKKNWLYVAVADCTGHGVPGALMSMLGISFLNEIIAKSDFISAANILDQLREQVISSLNQYTHETQGNNSSQSIKDGMDISLIAINLEDYKLQFAGANNPCWIINPSLSQEIIELKADKMPIAVYPEITPFSNTEIQLSNNSCVYLFTDGYADQFGGPEGKKFMRKRFKEMILKSHHLTIQEQFDIYNTAINSWIGDKDQTDDITLLGIKIII